MRICCKREKKKKKKKGDKNSNKFRVQECKVDLYIDNLSESDVIKNTNSDLYCKQMIIFN